MRCYSKCVVVCLDTCAHAPPPHTHRTVCYDLSMASLDVNRFQRSVLKKGTVLKRSKAGTFGERYAVSCSVQRAA